MEKQLLSPQELVGPIFEVDSLFLLVLHEAPHISLEFVSEHERERHHHLSRTLDRLDVVAVVLQLLPNPRFFVVLVGPLRDLSPVKSHFVAASLELPIQVLCELVLLEGTVDVSLAVGLSILVLTLIQVLVFLLDNNDLVSQLDLDLLVLIDGVQGLFLMEQLPRDGVSADPLSPELESFLLEVKSSVFKSVKRRAVESSFEKRAVEIVEPAVSDAVLHVVALVKRSVLQNQLALSLGFVFLPFPDVETAVGKELHAKSISQFLAVDCLFLTDVKREKGFVLYLLLQMIHNIIKCWDWLII